MTGLKVALSTLACFGGVSTVLTGTIISQVPSISDNTPVTLTLGLVFAGVFGTGVAVWKVSRAWSQMESKVAVLQSEVASLKKSRSAQIREMLQRAGHEVDPGSTQPPL